MELRAKTAARHLCWPLKDGQELWQQKDIAESSNSMAIDLKFQMSNAYSKVSEETSHKETMTEASRKYSLSCIKIHA